MIGSARVIRTRSSDKLRNRINEAEQVRNTVISLELKHEKELIYTCVAARAFYLTIAANIQGPEGTSALMMAYLF